MTRAALAVLSAALVSCAPNARETVETASEAEGLSLSLAIQGVCDARTLAAAGDVQGAAATFETRSHAELHTIADRLAARDREASARLLEAKQRVEAAFAGPAASPEAAAGALVALEAEVANAADALGVSRPVCAGAAG